MKVFPGKVQKMHGNQDGQNHKRHCMVVHAYYPLGETRVERQAMALLDHGFEVDVLCLQAPDQPGEDTVDGVQIYRLPVQRHKSKGLYVQLLEYMTFFLYVFIRLIRLHYQRRYRTIQVHNLPDLLVFAALIPRLSGARIILDLHDLMPEFYAERLHQSPTSLQVRLVRWQERLSCGFADHVITVTELWREALIKRGQPAEKVSVVMNVADDRIFHQDAVDNTPEDDDRFGIIYHGVMGQRHGLDLALRAIDQVRQTASEVHITLHGSGEYRQTLEKLVNQLDLQDHVQFSTQFVPTSELPHLIKKADLAVVPYRDGLFTGGILPTKMMEYAALGMPVIAARTPAIAAYFDETMVQFFTPGDVNGLAECILRLHDDRQRLAQLACNIKKFNQHYNWNELGARYATLVIRIGIR